MNFSRAKFLDVVFDLVVGRGFQAVLAFVTYKIGSKVLSKLLETITVSYTTFEALAFVSPSLVQSGNLLHELLMTRALQARGTIMMLLFSSAFVLAFPTLASVMAGHSNNWHTQFQTQDGRNVSWSEIHVNCFVIYNDGRIVSNGTIPVHSPSACLDRAPGMPTNSSDTGLIYRRDEAGGDLELEDHDDEALWNSVPPPCVILWRTVYYISEYGFSPSRQIPSEYYFDGDDFDLEPPTLTITSPYDSKPIETLVEILNNSLHGVSTPCSTSHSLI